MVDHIKAIIALSFSGAIGILLVVLGCALKDYGVWWPMFVLLFYVLAPVPTVVAKRLSEDFSSSGSNVVKEVSMFITSGIVISAFGLPIVLARCGIVHWGAVGLVMSGNVFIFFTILAYFLIFSVEDDWGF
ncbi:leptin receptor gene-related protein isoform X2 [Nematostella vectensis]|uniref:leptin receptor gene-related protein isoform X2 n=1 Tax=Nematostella vectensis TaxID=45351 RepID=UPI00138FC2A6|nr:leptin receptor gene-related protein isoform X2 [Nematostella vectensis]